jgi:ABC-2 type transport system ATP-binding protein
VEIEARGLRKRFGAVCALDGVSFDVPVGRRVALVGPNGSGKSTLNRALLGLVRCEGALRVGGVAPLERRVEAARRMAYVPQIAPQLGAPVGELVRAIGALRGIAPDAVAAVARELEVDLGALAQRAFRDLSGGTKQKLLLALAFAAAPQLLILDEPTGSLDSAARERFLALYDRLAPGTTVVLCSHRIEELRQLVDHVLAMQDGRLVHDGPAAEFLGARASALLEVRASGEPAALRLAALGFRRGVGGWWLRRVVAREKVELLTRLSAELGPALADVEVRGLESLELGGAVAGGAERERGASVGS